MNEDMAATECEFAFEKQPQEKGLHGVRRPLRRTGRRNCIDTRSAYVSCRRWDARVGDGDHLQGRDLRRSCSKAIEGYDEDFEEDNVQISVERYNELCAAGVRRGLREEGEVPVARAVDGPFYAQRMGMGLCLCTMGGLSSDEEAHVLDTDHEVIPGLYVSGNAQGDRFAVKYPFKLSGTSHAWPCTTARWRARTPRRGSSGIRLPLVTTR